MATVTLKRLELKVPKEGDARLQIAEKARDLLGYRGMLRAKGVCGALGAVLAHLEIKPFDPERVAQYKKQKAAVARKEASEKRRSSYYYISVTWKAKALSGYKGNVPEFALRKAIQIKEQLPEAIFKVEELKVNRVKYDPFLTVEHKGEKYWIEVWDENEFENQMIDDE